MIEFLLECLLQVVLEILGQLVFEVIAALGWESIGGSRRAVFKDIPILTGIAQLIFGGLAGATSLAVFGSRLTRPVAIPGLSLILAPIGTGIAMQWLGEFWRDWRDRPALFTFRGGAIFAFGMAAVRFAWLEVIGR